MKAITIKDVATHAGVSISTVSRYLNGNSKIEPLSKMRIEQAVRELNYMPNASARSLKSQSTHVVGIIVSDIANGFFVSVCRALESVISQYDYNLIICSTYEDRDRESKYIKMLTERRVDAMVICPSGKNQDLLESIRETGIPVIVIDRDFDELAMDKLVENNEEASCKLTQSLLSAGHRKIAILTGMSHSKTAQQRVGGVKRAYEEAGIPFEHACIFDNLADEKAAYEALRIALSQPQPCTAVAALNPKLTNGAVVYVIKNRICIPQDLSFTGITLKDDTKILPFDFERAEQDPVSIGLKAGEMIVKSIRGAKQRTDLPTRIVFKQRIVHGNSIGKP